MNFMQNGEIITPYIPARAEAVQGLRDGISWREFAACKLQEVELFTEEINRRSKVLDQARKFCAACPVVQQCFEEALSTEDVHSFRAGLTGRERLFTFRYIRRFGPPSFTAEPAHDQSTESQAA